MEDTAMQEAVIIGDNGSEVGTVSTGDIQVQSELKRFIPPLTADSKQQLEQNIKHNGCLDPLTVWKKTDGELVLIDGHNRLEICQRNGISFKVRLHTFTSKEQAKDWMLNHQLGRRNLNPDQLSYFRGLKYERMKKKRGGYDKVLSSGQSGDKTSEILAKEFNVSDRTILRDAEFAKGLELIGRTNPELKHDILSGNVKVKKGDVQLIAQEKDARKVSNIKNAADLYNRAQAIRRAKQAHKDKQAMMEEDARIKDASDELKLKDPVFSSKEERLQMHKGRIISAINKAISRKDKASLKQAKDYLKRIEDELFGKFAGA
ncbi:MAG: ParB N-terminal domain-containing protein [Tunicatimonas sp.]|uniref:ParB N-terminal domain-containing protein n=1 Tax=Tunicatimonas sp. TaxID=1940096 RepID=UPI003C797079